MDHADCIFCKLANGVYSTSTLYEDDDFRVILDRGPATKGHALILPKKHFSDIYDLDDAIAGKALLLAKEMAVKMTQAFQCDGFNIVQNNGEAAGQTVFHFHIHLIPRYKNDDAQLGWKSHTVADEELAAILAQF